MKSETVCHMLARKRDFADEVIVDFELPPSVNNAWVNTGRGRARSRPYQHWINNACAVLADLRICRVDGPYTCEIEARMRKKGRPRDIDNIIKPTLDLLGKVGITVDDRHCREVTARWVDHPTGRGMIVVIRRYQPEQLRRIA